MPKTIVVAFSAIALFSACLAPRDAAAIEQNSAACKRELQAAHNKMEESLALITGVQNAPPAAKCKAYSRGLDLVGEIRESFARCEEQKARTEAVRDVDEVFDATEKAFAKWCPTRPGMVRVHMTEVTHVTRAQLPKPLAAVHTCAGDGPMYFANERFDLGRLVMLGCPGNPNPTAADIKARNARAELLQKEQAALYVTRDRDGDDPQRLSFPILAADGSETSSDTLIAERVSIGEKLDLISSFWEPAKDGVCRIHAVWRVADGKAKLVLWQELADCASHDFKTLLDRR